jgi:hypothetical protein
VKRPLFWDITLCSLVKTTNFSEGHHLDLQGQNVSQERSQQTVSCCLLHTRFLLSLFLILKMEAICSSETSVDFTRLHDVLQKI